MSHGLLLRLSRLDSQDKEATDFTNKDWHVKRVPTRLSDGDGNGSKSDGGYGLESKNM